MSLTIPQSEDGQDLEGAVRLEVPQPTEPSTPVVPDAPIAPADPDPGTPAAPEQPSTVPGPDEPATPVVPEPSTGTDAWVETGGQTLAASCSTGTCDGNVGAWTRRWSPVSRLALSCSASAT